MIQSAHTRFLVTTVLIASTIGCAGPGEDRRAEPPPSAEDAARPEDRDLRRQEIVDVYSIAGDDWTESWHPSLPPPADSILGDGPMSAAVPLTESENQSPERMIKGFRVQLADVLKHGEALAIKSRASALFDNIYITFRSPNYKVRAGDFQRRADADKMAIQARQNGFRDAWVVPDRVYANPPEKPAEELEAHGDDEQVSPGDTLSVPHTPEMESPEQRE